MNYAMRKALKLIALSLSALLLLILGAIVIFIITVDPADYKPLLSEQVRAATDRELTINGSIQLTLFPRLGIAATDADLANPEGFSQPTFAHVDRIQLKIKALPLLLGQVRLGHTYIEGLQLFLNKTSSGAHNWHFDSKANRQQTTTATSKRQLELADVTVSNSSISYSDDTQQQQFSITNLGLDTDGLNTAGNGFDVKLHFTTRLNKTVLLPIQLETTITLDHSAQPTRLTSTTLSFDKLVLKAKQIQLQYVKSLNIDGDISVPALNLREYLTKLTLNINTPNQAALQNLSASAILHYDPTLFSLNNIKLELDASKLTGSFKHHVQQGYRFKFNIDKLNLDSYLGKPANKPKRVSTKTIKHQPIANRLQQLRLLSTINIKQLKYRNLNFSNFVLPLYAKDGLIKVGTLTADFYDGIINSTLTTDATVSPWQTTAITLISGASAKPLLSTLAGSDELSGKVKIDSNLKMTGITPKQWLKTMTGSIAFRVNRGQLNHINLIQQMQKAIATMHETKVNTNSNESTEFSTLSGTFIIEHGKASNNDLLLRHPLLQVTGTGFIRLADQLVQYHAVAKASNITVPVPIKITGRLPKPNIVIDIEQLIKHEAQRQLKKQIGVPTNLDQSDDKNMMNQFLKQQFKNLLH